MGEKSQKVVEDRSQKVISSREGRKRLQVSIEPDVRDYIRDDEVEEWSQSIAQGHIFEMAIRDSLNISKCQKQLEMVEDLLDKFDVETSETPPHTKTTQFPQIGNVHWNKLSKGEKKTNVNTMVSPDVHAAVKEKAKQDGTNMSIVVNNAVVEFLNNRTTSLDKLLWMIEELHGELSDEEYSESVTVQEMKNKADVNKGKILADWVEEEFESVIVTQNDIQEKLVENTDYGSRGAESPSSDALNHLTEMPTARLEISDCTTSEEEYSSFYNLFYDLFPSYAAGDDVVAAVRADLERVFQCPWNKDGRRRRVAEQCLQEVEEMEGVDVEDVIDVVPDGRLPEWYDRKITIEEERWDNYLDDISGEDVDWIRENIATNLGIEMDVLTEDVLSDIDYDSWAELKTLLDLTRKHVTPSFDEHVLGLEEWEPESTLSELKDKVEIE